MMKRKYLNILSSWQINEDRKPLLLRGARQVGKSYLVEHEFGKSFEEVVTVNFEKNPAYRSCFESNLDPKTTVPRLEALTKKSIHPGKTLLFLDELQECPRAITALRYFYEELPSLHVIGAGSLLEFALGEMSFPVGRVRNLQITPLTFYEFLENGGHSHLLSLIGSHDFSQAFPEGIHEEALSLFDRYLVLGGMPEVLNKWFSTNNIHRAIEVHEDIITSYRQDFPKYAKHKSTLDNIDAIFTRLCTSVGEQLTYSRLAPGVRSEYAKAVVNLLEKALVIRLVRAAEGVPLSGTVRNVNPKPLFVDTGLYLHFTGVEASKWLSARHTLLNFGQAAEQYVGQELVAYSSDPRDGVYYWTRDKRGASAEVDYVVQRKGELIPVEVKSGAAGTLKSMKVFLDQFKEQSPYGVKISRANFSQTDQVRSIPFYAVGEWLQREMGQKEEVVGGD